MYNREHFDKRRSYVRLRNVMGFLSAISYRNIDMPSRVMSSNAELIFSDFDVIAEGVKRAA
jgi:hypothetical protein